MVTMKAFRRFLELITALALILSLAACGGAASTASPAAPSAAPEATAAPAAEEILIGCLNDISGATSSSGKMIEAGIQWAIDEINANGGVNGATLRMITYDTKGDVSEAINAYTRAVTVDKVSVVVGPPVSNIALAIAPLSEQYDVPLLGLAIDPKAQAKEEGVPYKNMFCLQPSSVQMGDIMAQYGLDAGFQNFGIIYNEANSYSITLHDSFSSTIEAGGGQIVEDVGFTANDKDFKTLLSKIINKDVDAIFAPNYPQELILISQQARALGYEKALIFGVDASAPFPTLMGGESLDGIYYINNYDEELLADMAAQVKEKTGIDATNKFYLGYDITKICASIFEEVGNDPKALRDRVENLSGYEGITGAITMDPKTHMPTGLEMIMYTYEGTTPVKLDKYAAK